MPGCSMHCREEHHHVMFFAGGERVCERIIADSGFTNHTDVVQKDQIGVSTSPRNLILLLNNVNPRDHRTPERTRNS